METDKNHITGSAEDKVLIISKKDIEQYLSEVKAAVENDRYRIIDKNVQEIDEQYRAVEGLVSIDDIEKLMKIYKIGKAPLSLALGFQMVLALGIEHTTRALNAQSAVDEMTNEMLKRNAETLRQGAIDAAAASERGIVDVETLRKVNSDIIASINEVVKIHEEGSKKRAEAQEELVKIEDELKQSLLEVGNRS